MKRLILFLFVFMAISGVQGLLAQSPFPLVSSGEALERLSNSGADQKTTISALAPSDPAVPALMRKLEVYYAVARSIMNGSSSDEAVISGVGLVYGGGLTTGGSSVPKGVESKNMTTELYQLLKQ